MIHLILKIIVYGFWPVMQPSDMHVTPRVLALHNLTCITWAWSSRIHKQAFTIETFDWNVCNICLLLHVSLSYATFLVISCLHVYLQMIMNENMYLVDVSHKNM